MASFVEKATLKLIDDTSKNADRIDAKLKQLTLTAKQTQSALRGLNAPSSIGRSYTKATAAIAAFNRAVAAASVTKSMAIDAKGSKSVKDLANALQKYRENSRNIRTLTLQAPNISLARVEKLNALTKALKAYSRAVASLPARSMSLPRVPTDIAGRGAPGHGGTSPGRRSRMDGVPLTLPSATAASLTSVIKAAIVLGFAKASADVVLNRTTEGLKQRDVAENRIRMLQLPAGQEEMFNKVIREVTAGQKSQGSVLFNEGQVGGMVAEIIPIVKGNVQAVKELIPEVLSLARMQVATGETSLNATDNAFNFVKAAEMAGRLSNSEGNFDKGKAVEFFSMLRGVSSEIGKEFSGTFVRNATKYLQSSKGTLDMRSMAANLLMNEEMGTSASVGLNQALKQLSGNSVDKKQLANQVALGLTTTREVKSGTVNGKTKTKTVVDRVRDAELLDTSPMEWIQKNLIPLFQNRELNKNNAEDRKLIDAGLSKNVNGKTMGLDVNNAVDVRALARNMVSNQTAQSSIMSAITRMADIMQSVDRAFAKNNDKDVVGQKTAGSSTLSFEAVSNQITGSLGKIANSVKNNFVPALNSLSEGLNTTTSKILGEQGGKEQAKAIFSVGAIGTVVATALKGLWDFSKENPGGAMTVAATAHLGAAKALTTAAGVLAKNGVGVPIAPSKGTRGPGAPGPSAAPAPAGKVGIAASTLAWTGALSMATHAFSDILDYATQTKEQYRQQNEDQIEKNKQRFDEVSKSLDAAIKKALPKEIAEPMFGNKIPDSVPFIGGQNKFNPERWEKALSHIVTSAVNAADKVIKSSVEADTKGKHGKFTEKKAQAREAFRANNEKERKRQGVDTDGMDKLINQLNINLQKIPDVVQPKTAGDLGIQLVSATDSLQNVFLNGATHLQTVGSTIDTAAQNFGPTAGQGIVPFGSKFGEAAAGPIGAAIANAVSNIKVNVSGPNVGPMSPKG